MKTRWKRPYEVLRLVLISAATGAAIENHAWGWVIFGTTLSIIWSLDFALEVITPPTE